MERKKSLDGKLLETGLGGGGPVRGGGGSFKPPAAYEIWKKPIGSEPARKVGTATSLKSANRVIDRRDNEYGAYVHYKKPVGGKEYREYEKPVGPTKPRWVLPKKKK